MAGKEVALGLQKFTSIFSLETLLPHHLPSPCFSSILPLLAPAGLVFASITAHNSQSPVLFYKDWDLRADHLRVSSSCFFLLLFFFSSGNLQQKTQTVNSALTLL